MTILCPEYGESTMTILCPEYGESTMTVLCPEYGEPTMTVLCPEYSKSITKSSTTISMGVLSNERSQPCRMHSVAVLLLEHEPVHPTHVDTPYSVALY